MQEFYFPSIKFVITSMETDTILSGRSVLDLFFFSLPLQGMDISAILLKQLMIYWYINPSLNRNLDDRR